MYVPLAERWTRPAALHEPTQVVGQPWSPICVRSFVLRDLSTYPVTKPLNIILRQLLAVHQAFYPTIKGWYRRWLCRGRESVWLRQFANVHIHLRIHSRFEVSDRLNWWEV